MVIAAHGPAHKQSGTALPVNAAIPDRISRPDTSGFDPMPDNPEFLFCVG